MKLVNCLLNAHSYAQQTRNSCQCSRGALWRDGRRLEWPAGRVRGRIGAQNLAAGGGVSGVGIIIIIIFPRS
jgi:hypothetical protein